jgi:hypothetical protein
MSEESLRTTLYVVMVSLCPQVIEIGQPRKADLFQLLWCNKTVAIQVDTFEDSLDNLVCLLLMLNLVLNTPN